MHDLHFGFPDSMLTYASELFLKNLAKKSFQNAKNKARNTIRFEDISEARTNDSALSFLEMLLP
jgi:histone H3/H4